MTWITQPLKNNEIAPTNRVLSGIIRISIPNNRNLFKQ